MVLHFTFQGFKDFKRFTKQNFPCPIIDFTSWAELGQAQLKLELNFTLTRLISIGSKPILIVVVVVDIDVVFVKNMSKKL